MLKRNVQRRKFCLQTASDSVASAESLQSTTSEDKKTGTSTLSSSSVETTNNLLHNVGNRLSLGNFNTSLVFVAFLFALLLKI